MSQNDWVPFFAEAVRRGQRDSTAPATATPVTDQALVAVARDEALALGTCERRARNAAVGAYLERYPGTSIHTAERIVAALMRSDDLESPGTTGADQPHR
jgi:hypothetical protein